MQEQDFNQQLPGVDIMDQQTLLKYWHAITEYKERFLQNRGEDPRICPYIHAEVAESWLRSQTMGVNPYLRKEFTFLDSKKFTETLRENEDILEITKHTFADLKLKEVLAKNYALYLFNAKGILLYMEGDKGEVDYSATQSGAIWSEEAIGTSAHVLCVRLKQPYTIIGPEHFCTVFHNSIVSAAPIANDKGQIIAALVLGVHLHNNPPLENTFYVRHTLGLVKAMAVAVENGLHSKKAMRQLEMAHYRQKATMSLIDQGIITVDRAGKMTYATKEAAHILRIGDEFIQGKNVRDFFSAETVQHIMGGSNIDVEETIFADNSEVSLFLNIRPILSGTTGGTNGAVLRFTPIEKINTPGSNRPGTTTDFTFQDIIGQSEALKKAVGLARRFTASPENILLIGESGTGKELFAQAIHNESCPAGPFMAVNCAAMPHELVESELFGYEGGSFTGAERSGRPGKIELAHGGTLFLDEIGDMPLELQAVLLRVLEDKRVMRLGGRRYKKVDFRLIAATNKDLIKLVKEKSFRDDLFYRLFVLNLHLPPLRDRKGDIAFLIEYFIEKYCRKMHRKGITVSTQAEKIMRDYPWPGNVRQLENAVIYAINIVRGDVLEAKDLPPYLLTKEAPSVPVEGDAIKVYKIEMMEKVLIENAIFKTKNNITKAAELLGLAKSTLYRKIKEYGIDVEE
jgi:transcriptional regulator with PAS, ATPase and Fis domain